MTNPDVTITVYDTFVTVRSQHATFMIGSGAENILLKAVGHGERTVAPEELVRILRNATAIAIA